MSQCSRDSCSYRYISFVIVLTCIHAEQFKTTDHTEVTLCRNVKIFLKICFIKLQHATYGLCKCERKQIAAVTFLDRFRAVTFKKLFMYLVILFELIESSRTNFASFLMVFILYKYIDTVTSKTWLIRRADYHKPICSLAIRKTTCLVITNVQVFDFDIVPSPSLGLSCSRFFPRSYTILINN